VADLVLRALQDVCWNGRNIFLRGDCQNPQPSRPADPRPAARPGAASRFIPDNLRAENRLPTQADGAARSEFERAARSGTLRAPPTTTPPKPAEATLGFSSTRKTIDTSPGWRYSSDQKKRLFKFPIRKGGYHSSGQSEIVRLNGNAEVGF